MKTRLVIVVLHCHCLKRKALKIVTRKVSTPWLLPEQQQQRQHLNKRLWKRTISYSQSVIGCIRWLMCWWPCRFNYLLKHWMNYTVSHHCRTKFIGQVHCWHKQTVRLASMELSSFVPAVSLARHPVAWIQSPLKSMERACDFKGLWIMSGAPCVLPATELVILQITMYIHLLSWHILTEEWDWKCIPSSKYSIFVTQAHI